MGKSFKYFFLFFSLAVIAYGLYYMFVVINPGSLQRWPDKITLYLFLPLILIATYYYLHFFLPKYKEKFRSAKPFLTLLSLCSVLYLVIILVDALNTFYASGNTFAFLHWFSGLYFHIFLPLLGLIGLFIRHKIGWILSLVFPCYMICKIFAGTITSIHFISPHLLYPYLVYGVIFPLVCSLPVIRNHFRIHSAKELYFCVGIVILITILFVILTPRIRA